jgi:hypothetical protein
MSYVFGAFGQGSLTDIDSSQANKEEAALEFNGEFSWNSSKQFIDLLQHQKKGVTFVFNSQRRLIME